MAINRTTLIGVLTFGVSFMAGTWLWSDWGYSRALEGVDAVARHTAEQGASGFVLTYDAGVNRAELLSAYDITAARPIGMNAYQFHVRYANGSEHDVDVFPRLLGDTRVHVH